MLRLFSLNDKKGFTLLEVLLSVSIIAIIAGLSVPIYQSFQNRNNLDIASASIIQSFRRAQLLSQSFSNDSDWGIKLQTGQIIVFSGPSYVSKDSNFDENVEISSSLSLSGLDEVVFSKFSGLPQTTGSVTLTSTNNETRTITINEKGTIDF